MEEEKVQLLEAIGKNDVDKVKALLSISKLPVDFSDDGGMTPLSHACFKGNLEIIEELLLRGANVNSNEHKQGYTPLMFAALSGKIDCVKRLLHAGAKTHPQNAVNRTASQMAAFVGQHGVVSVINNFVGKAALERYSKPDGVKQEVRLPPALVDPLHSLLISANMSPVRVSLYLRNYPELLQEYLKVLRVLEDMCSRNFLSTEEPNEILSLKCHVLACVVRAAGKKFADGDTELKEHFKTLLKGSPHQEGHDGEEELLRNALRDYPYGQSSLFQQLLRQLTHSPIGGESSAFGVLFAIWNGQQMFAPTQAEEEEAKAHPTGPCATCHEAKATKLCGQCRKVFYCDANCQRLHWFAHKRACVVAKLRQDIEEANKAANEAQPTNPQSAVVSGDANS